MVLAISCAVGLSVAKSSMECPPEGSAGRYSNCCSPELLPCFQPRAPFSSVEGVACCLGLGSRVTSTQIALGSLSCPDLFPLCGNSGPQTYILSPCVSRHTLCPAFTFEMRGLLTVHVPASGQKTDVKHGRFSCGTSVKEDSCLKEKGSSLRQEEGLLCH